MLARGRAHQAIQLLKWKEKIRVKGRVTLIWGEKNEFDKYGHVEGFRSRWSKSLSCPGQCLQGHLPEDSFRYTLILYNQNILYL